MAVVCLGAEVRSDFEGGSVGRVERLQTGHFRIGVKGETDQAGRNRQASWYYFRVDGAPKSEMIFDMVGLAGEYNYKPNKGAITGDTPPVISYDGKTWKHLTSIEYDGSEPRLRLRVTPSGPRFRIAHTPPYTHIELSRLRRDVLKGAKEETIGKSVEGRDLLLWTIESGSPSKTVWLMFRQHSWESGSSWVGEGAVRSLLANRELSSGIRWKILPMADPDGVARGGVRFNRNGYDLNRNWDMTDPQRMPEITAQRTAIANWLRSANTVDLFYSLHNTETSEYLEAPPDGASDLVIQRLAQRLFSNLTEHTTFAPSRPLFYAASTTTEGMKGRMTVVQGLWRDFRIPAFLMEQRIAHNDRLKGLPTVADRLSFGRQLVEAIAHSLR